MNSCQALSSAHVNSFTSRTFWPSTKALPVILAMPTSARHKERLSKSSLRGSKSSLRGSKSSLRGSIS